MTSIQNVRRPLADAIQYPVGLEFDVTFDEFSVRLTGLPDNRLRFHIVDGPFARTEEVRIATTLIRPGIFLLSWVESSGATVVQVEDFAESTVHSHATLPSGTFFRMTGPIQVTSREAF